MTGTKHSTSRLASEAVKRKKALTIDRLVAVADQQKQKQTISSALSPHTRGHQVADFHRCHDLRLSHARGTDHSHSLLSIR